MYMTEELEACRAHTLHRDHDDSGPVGWIRGFTKIGKVIQVNVTYYAEQHLIEIQFTFNDEKRILPMDCDIQRNEERRGRSP